MRFIYAILLLLSFVPSPLIAQNQTIRCDSLLQKAIQERHEKRFDSAIQVIETYLDTCNDSLNYALQLSILNLERADTEYNSNGKRSKKERLELFQKGLQYARIAYKIDSLHRHPSEYLALSFAGIISVSNLYQQAHLADSVRIYAEKMLAINPNNARALHILGRWHFEVASLGWIVRFFSKLIFGVSPQGDYTKAIHYFERAVSLENYVVHNYWLGMTLLKNKQKEKARRQFEYTLRLSNHQHNDSYLKSKIVKVIADEF
jgi:tetratricopeptide (TPR) repeat protein